MEIRLDQLSDPHFKWRERLELTQDGPTQDDLLDIDAIECRGTIDSTASGHVLRLQLAYRQKLSCVRCLRDFETDMDRELDLLINIRPEGMADEDDELGLEQRGAGRARHGRNCGYGQGDQDRRRAHGHLLTGPHCTPNG